MGHKFADIMFTESVQRIQQQQGSFQNYVSWQGMPDHNQLLTENEKQFIEDRDSFYMASVSESGWPYLQHRGGPAGFVQVLDEGTLGFADFSGNRQYISTGNFSVNDRVALFFMDYPNQLRLKLLGRVEVVEQSHLELLAQLEPEGYRAPAERGFIIRVEAFDWNCPQHITPRYTQAQIDRQLAALRHELDQSSGQSPPSDPMGALGSGPLSLQITGVRQLAPDIRAYELRDPEAQSLPKVRPGSHLRIPLPGVSGNETRSYSICSNPARRDAYEIAVLRETNGRGSEAIHQQFGLNQILHCDLPLNDFELHTDNRSAVFIAGGIGITPIKAMAHAAKARGIEFHIHYAGKSLPEMAFSDRLEREFGDRLTLYPRDLGKRMELPRLIAELDAQSVVYCCGPERLIHEVQNLASKFHVEPDRVRMERFSAPRDNNRALDVHLKRSGLSLHVPADKTVLEVMLEAGIESAHSCRAGNCKSCMVTVLEGEVEHHDHCLTSDEQQRWMCPCVSRAQSEALSLDI